jgi:hypothetical protein
MSSRAQAWHLGFEVVEPLEPRKFQAMSTMAKLKREGSVCEEVVVSRKHKFLAPWNYPVMKTIAREPN